MYWPRVDYLAKSRLRALNTVNESVTPVHTDVNARSLQKSWKIWYKLFTGLYLGHNTKIAFESLKRGRSLRLDLRPYHCTRKCKSFFYWSRWFTGCKKGFAVGTGYTTHVKVVLTANFIRVVFLLLPQYHASAVRPIYKPYSDLVLRCYELVKATKGIYAARDKKRWQARKAKNKNRFYKNYNKTSYNKTSHKRASNKSK